MISKQRPTRKTNRGTDVRTLTDRASKNLELAKVWRAKQSGVSKWTLATAVDAPQVLHVRSTAALNIPSPIISESDDPTRGGVTARR